LDISRRLYHRVVLLEIDHLFCFVDPAPTGRCAPAMRGGSSTRASSTQASLRTPVPIQNLLAKVTPRIAWHIGSPQCLEVILGDSSSTVLKLAEEVSLIG
jgi:cellulase/cellobiase CelA1